MMPRVLSADGKVLTENGRVIVGADCGCDCLGGDGGPVDPPPPVEPGTFYRASPCDPDQPPLERPVVLYIPPRNEWPPGGFQYNCTSLLVQGANGNACFGIDGNSPKVEGDVERPPGNPYTIIDGVEYIERTPSPVKLTCCACRPDCGVIRREYFTVTFQNGPHENPHCGCDFPPCDTLPERDCCCNAAGDINYVTDVLEYNEQWTFCKPGLMVKTSFRRETVLRGKCERGAQTGTARVTVKETTTTYDQDCRQIVNVTQQEYDSPINECGCKPVLLPGQTDRFECRTIFNAIKCSGFVQYVCSRYSGRKECETQGDPGLPSGLTLLRWNAEALFDQGDCLSGCKDESEVIARPGGVDRKF